MAERKRSFLAAPLFADEETSRIAEMLNIILLVIAGLVSLFIVVSLVTVSAANLIVEFVLLAVVAGLWGLMRRGRVRLSASLLSLLLWVAVTAGIAVGGGLRGTGLSSYFGIVLIAGLLLGSYAAFAAAVLSIVATAAMLYAETLGLLPPLPAHITSSYIWLEFTVTLLGITGLLHVATRSLNRALDRARRYAGELETQRARLEEMVEERTQDLLRRARYLEATAAVTQETSAVLELEELMRRAVSLTAERFAFDHVGLFLLDESGQWAILRVASSPEGQLMLSQSYRLRVDEESVVGQAAASARARLALDMGATPVRFGNVVLPEMRSEIALPLRARGEVIGVLDVRSRRPRAFDEQDVAALQMLADQFALAISNARLYQQAQESLLAEREAYGEMTLRAWRDLTRQQQELGYLSTPQGERQVGGAWHPTMVRAGLLEQTVHDDPLTVAVPLKVRGRTLGVVRFRKPEHGGEWSAEEMAVLETLTEQLGSALESVRLYQETQRTAARERLVGEIVGQLRASLDPDTILKTTVRELGRVLRAEHVAIEVSGPQGDGQEGGEHDSENV